MLQTGLYSDVQIILNEGEPIKAHKCVLMARSEKFKTMLNVQMKEVSEGVVRI